MHTEIHKRTEPKDKHIFIFFQRKESEQPAIRILESKWKQVFTESWDSKKNTKIFYPKQNQEELGRTLAMLKDLSYLPTKFYKWWKNRKSENKNDKNVAYFRIFWLLLHCIF